MGKLKFFGWSKICILYISGAKGTAKDLSIYSLPAFHIDVARAWHVAFFFLFLKSNLERKREGAKLVLQVLQRPFQAHKILRGFWPSPFGVLHLTCQASLQLSSPQTVHSCCRSKSPLCTSDSFLDMHLYTYIVTLRLIKFYLCTDTHTHIFAVIQIQYCKYLNGIAHLYRSYTCSSVHRKMHFFHTYCW